MKVERIVLVDFAGTLIRAEMIEEANRFRSDILERDMPSKAEHASPQELYKSNREYVAALTGLSADMIIEYRKNDLGMMNLTGVECQNQIATNLFQLGMYRTAKKHGVDVFPEGILEQLKRIKSAGYKLAIVSGVRQDIISGVLQIAGAEVEFDHVYAQPPKLGVDNESNMASLAEHGKVEFVIGDKMSDLEPGKAAGAKTIFVKWGHASGGEEGFADFTITKAEELSNIIE